MAGKNVLGLDIGSSSVKIMELKEVRGAYQLQKFGMARLPSEAIVDGALMNKVALCNSFRLENR